MQGKEINRGADVRSKNGVFLCKDQKITALETANQQLRLELQREVEEFNQLNKESADVRSKYSSFQTQISFQQIEQAMLQQSIHKSEKTIAECQAFLQQTTPKIAKLSEEISHLQQDLQIKMKQSTASGNLIKRYGEEIRNQKLILKSDKNFTKVAQNFKKSYENYEKNVYILKNKLQGKKKYLMILTKKVNKQKQSEKIEEQTNARQKYGESRVRERMEENKRYMGNIVTKEKETEKKEDKQTIKSFNDTIRKKNAILAQKK